MEKLFLFEDDLITDLSEDQSPGHLDQIELFYEDTDSLFDSISDVIADSHLAVTFASVRAEQFPAPADQAKGWLLHWPDHQKGLTCVVRSDGNGQQNSLVAVFPFFNDGIQYHCRVNGVRRFASRFEAQIEALVGDDELLSLTFYDCHYLSDRNVYRKNAAYRFVLRSFAYHFNLQSPADSEFFSAVFNREDLGADHYELQGPVRKVEEIAGPFLGQKAWNVHIVVANSEDGEEMLLPVIITARLLGKGSLPKPGDSLQALVWLQGHLWGVEEDS